MKIALISPRVGFTTRIKELEDLWFNSKEASPYRYYWTGVSSGLLTVAALTPADIDVDFVDENMEEIDFDAGYDLAGISAMTQQSTRAYQIADEFRKRNVTVIMGGIHATVLPEEVKLHVDSVVSGEVELLWADILKDFKSNRLKPFYKADSLFDLTKAPVPRFDLLKKGRYPIIWMETSRGCPHDCEYCASTRIFGNKYRNKSHEQVIRDIQFIKSHHSDTRIAFSDDNFLVNKRLAKDLLPRIADMDIRWHALCDISVGKDKKLLELLYKSGCTYLFIGLESVSTESLNSIEKSNWKSKQFVNYSENIKAIQSAGLGVMGSFIVGLDQDFPDVFDKMANFIIANNLYAASITILTPFPGTRLRTRMQEEGRLFDHDWAYYTGYNVNYMPRNVSVEQIETGLVNLYRSVYAKEVYKKKMVYFKKIQKELIKKYLSGVS
jgi:radical SAM superfamily enzyme YgiQ (UPF0313 family)